MLLAALAGIQFTHVMDFVVMMPLGPQFMRSFSIGPSEFSLMISAYTFSAAIFGLLGAFFIDRLDRKRALLILYAGFTLGTVFCALAPNHHLFIAARIFAGAFGGLMTATVYAIIADVFPPQRRGAAMGTVMSSFGLASIVGVPFGLYLSNLFSWHATFYFVAGLSAVVWGVAAYCLPTVRGHLLAARSKPIEEMKRIFSDRNHLWAFSITIALMMAGFTIFPYLSTYLVTNAGMTEQQLPYVYLCGGSFTVFTSRLIGKLCDRQGARKVFTVMSLISMIPVVVVTNLTTVPLPVALACSTFFMIFASGRMVASMPMITASVLPRNRGSFMSMNTAIQQMAGGLGAYISGLFVVMVGEPGQTGATMQGYWKSGVISVFAILLCVWLARKLKPVDQTMPGAYTNPPETALAGATLTKA